MKVRLNHNCHEPSSRAAHLLDSGYKILVETPTDIMGALSVISPGPAVKRKPVSTPESKLRAVIGESLRGNQSLLCSLAPAAPMIYDQVLTEELRQEVDLEILRWPSCLSEFLICYHELEPGSPEFEDLLAAFRPILSHRNIFHIPWQGCRYCFSELTVCTLIRAIRRGVIEV